jgi:hypothetical protein
MTPVPFRVQESLKAAIFAGLRRWIQEDLISEDCMAEGEGFEPPLPFRVKRFSRPPVSTAHTSLRESSNNGSMIRRRPITRL